MADYIERIAPNGRRVHFDPRMPAAEQDAFLSNLGSESQGGQGQALGGQGQQPQPQEASQQEEPNRYQQYFGMPGQETGGLPWQNQSTAEQYRPRQGLPPKGAGGNPVNYQESPEDYGHNVAEEQGASRIGPQMLASMTPMGRLAKMGLAGRTLGNAAFQGGVAAAFNPEDALNQGGTAAAVTAPMHLLSEALMSKSKPARWLKSQIAPVMSAGAAFMAAKEAGLPTAAQYAAAAAAYKAGGKFINPKLDPNHHVKNYAEKISPYIDKTARQNYRAGRKMGIHLTPEEASQHSSVISEQGKLGKTGASKDLIQQGQKKQAEAVHSNIEKAQNKIYNPETQGSRKAEQLERYSRSRVEPNYEHKDIFKSKVATAAEDAFMSTPEMKEKFGHMKVADRRRNGEYLQGLKQQYDHRIAGLNSAPDSKMQHNVIKKAKDERAKLNNFIKENIAPAEEALRLSQLSKARGKVEDFFKSKLKDSKSFVDNFGNKDTHKELSRMLAETTTDNKNVQKLNVGAKDAMKNLEELHSVLKNVRSKSIDQIASGSSEAAGQVGSGSKKEMLDSFMKMFKNGDFDEAAIKFGLSKNWPAKIRQLNKISDTSKRAAVTVEWLKKLGVPATSQAIRTSRSDNKKEGTN